MTGIADIRAEAEAEGLRLIPEEWVHGSFSYDANGGARSHYVSGYVAGATRRETELAEALAAVGLPATATLADLIAHHRANAGTAAALDAMQHVSVESIDAARERARIEFADDLTRLGVYRLDIHTIRDQARKPIASADR